MDDVMDYIGLANIYEKKECIIDGKKQIYYEKIDCAYGFWYNFNNIGKSFVVLTGKIAGETIGSNSIYDYSSFRTLNELGVENNHIYNYNKFKSMNKYRDFIGDYFTYDSHERMFTRITNQDLLQKIRGTTKDYDDTILNNDTDISQMYSAIKKTIISQDEQIMQILTSLFKNQKVINSSLGLDMIAKLKENIIVYGSTGTGKTEI